MDQTLFDTLKKALEAGVAVSDMPAIIQQYLQFAIISALLWMGAGAVLAALGALCILVTLIIARRKECWEPTTPLIVTGAITNAIGLLIVFVNAFSYYKAAYTPLLFLTERAAEYFKAIVGVVR